jgi:hypothetical protein
MGTTGVICTVLVGVAMDIVFVWVNIDKIDEGLRPNNRNIRQVLRYIQRYGGNEKSKLI